MSDGTYRWTTGILLLVCIVILAYDVVWKIKHPLPKLSSLPGDPVSRDFYKFPGNPPCQILIPPGRALKLYGVVTISPSGGGQLDDPPAPIQVYGCHFNADTNAKVQEQIMEVKP